MLIVFDTNFYSHDIAEPDNYGGLEDCMLMYGGVKFAHAKGQWGDYRCNARAPFSTNILPICEKDMDFKGIFTRITGSRKKS